MKGILFCEKGGLVGVIMVQVLALTLFAFLLGKYLIAVVIVGVTEVMEGMVETIMGEEGTGMTMVAMEDMETIMEGMGDMVTTTRVDW